MGAGGSLVIKALCYKPEGRWFDTRLGYFLNLPNLPTRPWGLLSLLTEMSIGNIPIIIFLGSKMRWVNRADNLTAICEPFV
jgi:hypothetical protein